MFFHIMLTYYRTEDFGGKLEKYKILEFFLFCSMPY